jgi:hypothetical protein
MPIHDWSDVDANLFHDFHQTWCVNLCKSLNSGLLPNRLSALLERDTQTDCVNDDKEKVLASHANRISIRRRLSEVVCIIEIVSPGNKSSRAGLRSFVEKTHEFLNAGVNILILDLFPPTSRDPEGIHKAIWDQIDEDAPFNLPEDKPLTFAAYVAGDLVVGRSLKAYVQPISVGSTLPDMPAYLDAKYYVPVPLESTYQTTWNSCPSDFRYLVEHGRLPDEN